MKLYKVKCEPICGGGECESTISDRIVFEVLGKPEDYTTRGIYLDGILDLSSAHKSGSVRFIDSIMHFLIDVYGYKVEDLGDGRFRPFK